MAGQAALAHAALMMSGFLGPAIAIERAVAVKLRSAFVAPFASGVAGFVMLAGMRRPAAQPALHAVALGLIAGAALSGFAPLAGGVVYGAAFAQRARKRDQPLR